MTAFLAEITPDHILDLSDYEAVRKDRKSAIVAAKRDRRLAIGPDATIYFENRETMWLQIQEMLRIEKGGAAQLADELAAYNPMVPKGRNLSATFMIEIDDERRRDRVLGEVGHIDQTISIKFVGEKVFARADDDTERTDEDGKASSVHFLLFDFSDDQVEKFRATSDDIVISIGQENYRHMAVMSPAMQVALAADFA
ncbi:MAG: DUF3501 family protein [Alphaproteobacteria bacterium]|jgi:hypothetical protein|nr:DUF3501 family protein [Alphaproteobacteria bacterium]MBT4084826.1 DUF3501 family protein [Alphaproteobacteria bacterium]MBT4544782.1 DUF3501 family protein [Alphaproteobacteria bacterium]MBT5919865.1 DUF3501 family protein [Alphaproteobacteria bacterium]MBT6386032.1 DUF3501 family protein [Alphaproteobacteria bacterium]